MKEQWAEVVGFCNYQVSTLGRVRRLAGFGNDGRNVRSHILKCVGDRPYVTMVRGGKKYRVRVSILVLTAFAGPKPTPKHEARHLDDVSTHNTLRNLAWGTRLENRADAIRNGRMARGERNGTAILTEKQIAEFRREYQYRGEKNMRYFAKRFGVGHQTLWLVLHRKAWRHVG